jgi:tripartite-type tricarboxylate transporter receptor subunit TctC
VIKFPRRQFLHLAAGAAALPVLPRIAMAQTYPMRPVRIIVAFPAGGPTDIAARLLGQWLSLRLGQEFIVENRAGASGNIGTEAVVRSAPDGYTLLMAVSPNTINATLYRKLSYDFLRDVVPVANVAEFPLVMEVSLSFPVKTVPEFIAYAKANPGKIAYASAGIGTPDHVAGELFKLMAGVDMLHVPYRGGAPALVDLIAGQVQARFDPLASSVEYIKAGSLRPLAVTTATHSDALPDLPVVADFLPGFEASFWCGVGAPKNTPVPIIDTLNREINAGLADPRIKARFAELGGRVLPGSPADFGKFLAEDTEKWAKVVRFAGISAD